MEAVDLLKLYPDEDRPRTPEEVDILIESNALFVALTVLLSNLTIEEFKKASRAPVDRAMTEYHVRAIDRTTPEADAENAYIEAIALHVLAQRTGDNSLALEAAIHASDARGVLWATRDRINELVFPWADPALEDEDGNPANLF